MTVSRWLRHLGSRLSRDPVRDPIHRDSLSRKCFVISTTARSRIDWPVRESTRRTAFTRVRNRHVWLASNDGCLNEPHEWLQTAGLGPPAHAWSNDGCSTIANPGRVPSGKNARPIEIRASSSPSSLPLFLLVGATRHVQNSSPSGSGTSAISSTNVASLDRGDGPPMALRGEGVLLGARHVVAICRLAPPSHPLDSRRKGRWREDNVPSTTQGCTIRARSCARRDSKSRNGWRLMLSSPPATTI